MQYVYLLCTYLLLVAFATFVDYLIGGLGNVHLPGGVLVR